MNEIAVLFLCLQLAMVFVGSFPIIFSWYFSFRYYRVIVCCEDRVPLRWKVHLAQAGLCTLGSCHVV